MNGKKQIKVMDLPGPCKAVRVERGRSVNSVIMSGYHTRIEATRRYQGGEWTVTIEHRVCDDEVLQSTGTLPRQLTAATVSNAVADAVDLLESNKVPPKNKRGDHSPYAELMLGW